MFMTRERYEKALRRAKAEGRKEVMQKVQTDDRIAWVERSMNERMECFLRRLGRMEREMEQSKRTCKPHVNDCRAE